MGESQRLAVEFEQVEPPHDDGVVSAFAADESFSLNGEPIERRTELAILEDGGVHVQQEIENQNVFDSLTVSGDVLDELVERRSEEGNDVN